ncbi:acetylxylan esterase [Synoicihabitans lomoniglobus]|uniref:Acetylxylan esterase n=1 Tax=Synoicihabitans lomoniglobus TaxID=2909285 RepID=A0AAF0CHE1_9BACT|nr:acetylxylan esterase [Opitutaceae bacterium LMO-M01]WED64202.1 acetylxylan esterase [Opitutaceae bacterium LMO-M01]
MPAFDLPLDQLRTYRGASPRPADFDAYWEAGLRELDHTDPDPVLVPNSTITTPQTECFDLWFTGVGGARIHAQFVRPRRSDVTTANPGPAVLLFHGYSAACGDWSSLLGFAGAGLAIAMLDCRGQGGASEDVGGVKGMTLRGHFVRGLADPDPTKLLFRAIYLDTVQLARVVMAQPEIDAARVGAFGGSQGGALTLACAALEPRLKRIAPAFPFLSDFRRVWAMDLAENAYEELRYFLRINDPCHERVEEIFTRLGYIDVQHLAPRIQAEVLFFTGLMDNVCPPSSQFAVFNRITAPKEMVMYPDFAHEALPGAADRTFNFLLGL